ncbi:MAG: aminotransferase class III-fold pyridoxal phosphate-dependent enzyme [Rhizobiaceae bacterium]|nr:aminotransferase class III-fold pyridoxal phosphate-dependent enzyme [Rhizobiaceae bacterium]
MNADLEAADKRFHFHSQTDAARHEEAGPLMIARGEGAHVVDLDGRRYIDAVASLWCASLGFSDARLAAAGASALETLPVYHTFNHRSNPYVAELAATLMPLTPMPEGRVFFTDGGSEAVDSMVKMAWYYHTAHGEPSRRKIVARNGAFHGSTVMAARISGLPAMHRSFNLPDCNVVHTGRPHFYRDAQDGESEAAFVARLVASFEALIATEGADTIAAFIAEPVMGAGGVIVPPAGYLPAMAQVARRNGILVLSDEIICGFGRTGNWFGCQTLGFRPDMMSIAKGLSSGYAPIGGVVVSGEVYQALAQEAARNGVFSHGFTYSGHPVSAAISLEALRIYKEMELPAVAARLGARLATGLQLITRHPLVGNVRSTGFIGGVELMADRDSRTPFAPELKVGAMVERQTRAHGLIVRNLGDVIALCPPYVVTEDEVDGIFEKLARALDDVDAELRA